MLKSWKHLKLKPWVESSSSIQPNSWSAVPGNFAQLQGSLLLLPSCVFQVWMLTMKGSFNGKSCSAWHHLAYLPLPLKENLLCQVFEINCVLIYQINKTPCTIKKKNLRLLFLFSWLLAKLCVAGVNPWLLSGLCGHHTNEAASLCPTVRGLLSSLCPLIATSQALVLLNRGILNAPAQHWQD